LCINVIFTSIGLNASAETDRIYPTNKVFVYNGGQKTGVYTREAPLPEGAIISADGRCAVKLGELFLVGEDQSVFSTNTSGYQRNLLIKEGTIYFKTSKIRRIITFITPDGHISIQRIRLNTALNDQSITGYVTVEENSSELGVVQGGALDILTEDGQQTVKSGEKIILSQADMDIGAPEPQPSESEAPSDEQPPEQKKGMSKTMQATIVGGVAVLALGALAAAGGGGGGGGGGSDVSPSTP
jgi:hypothetical protein